MRNPASRKWLDAPIRCPDSPGQAAIPRTGRRGGFLAAACGARKNLRRAEPAASGRKVASVAARKLSASPCAEADSIVNVFPIRCTGRAAAREGFTLLEVLVSLAILSATLIMAYQVTSAAISAGERSEAWTTASLLGEAKLREVIETFPEIQETDGEFPDPHEDYAWRLVVKQALHADAREVYLTVSWQAGGTVETINMSGLAVR